MENKHYLKLLTISLTVTVMATLLVAGSTLNNAFAASTSGEGGAGGNGKASASTSDNSASSV